MTNLKVIGRKMNELWLLPNLKLVIGAGAAGSS